MGLTTADTYYLKARAAASDYIGNWNEACESLNYALSYDENHVPSLCLLGEIYALHLGSYPKAFYCFDRVITINNTYPQVYVMYAHFLIKATEYQKASKLLNFAFTIKGIDKMLLCWLFSCLEESQANYDAALEWLKKAKKHSLDSYDFDFFKEGEKRIRKKRKKSTSVKKTKKKRSKKRRNKNG